MRNLKKNQLLTLALSFLFVIVLMFSSCNKNDDFNTDPNFQLEFTNDSVVFDTVFTSIGSITKKLMVYNRGKKDVNISSIRLQNSENSFFQLNVDGAPGSTQEDIEIAAKDSMFIFIRLNIDPTNENNPFVVDDQIEFVTNGNQQDVKLVAWGQNANYIIGDQTDEFGNSFKIIAEKDATVNWDSPKPYVVYGTAIVDTNAILNIAEGCKIYFHNLSGLHAKYEASIKANGSLENPIIFKGDRLDKGYRDLPGMWNGITIEESDEVSAFNFVRIENGSWGIKASALNPAKANTISLNNTIIQNMTGFGISAKAFNFTSSNLIVSNCGEQLIDLIGGNSIFEHCTFANYWSGSFRDYEAITLGNSFSIGEETTNIDLTVEFGNCIIEGRYQNELEFNNSSEASFNSVFYNCSIKTNLDTSDENIFTNCLINPEVIFEESEEMTFNLNEESPLIDAGLLSIGQSNPLDFRGQSRLPNPDIGAIEFYSTEERKK